MDAEEKDGMLWVTLFDPEAEGEKEESINSEIIAEGLATVKRDLKGWETGRDDVVKRLGIKMAEAKEEKRGVWEYGEVEGEDD